MTHKLISGRCIYYLKLADPTASSLAEQSFHKPLIVVQILVRLRKRAAVLGGVQIVTGKTKRACLR